MRVGKSEQRVQGQPPASREPPYVFPETDNDWEEERWKKSGRDGVVWI